MRRTTRLHDNKLELPISEPALELRPGKPMMLDYAPPLIGDRHLEHVLCQVQRHGCSIHLGLLPSR
jgi:hypothetical protein